MAKPWCEDWDIRLSRAKSELAADDMEGCLAELEKEDKIEQLLVEQRAKRGA